MSKKPPVIEPDYGKEIKKAQKKTTYMIASKAHKRIRFGDEKEDWGKEMGYCGDCAVKVNHYHVPGCDVERCPKCQGQAIGCDCKNEDLWEDES